jgi:hypothetical protein
MPLLRLVNGFERLTDDGLLGKSYSIHQRISSNSSLFPDTDPTMAELKAICDEYQDAIPLAISGGAAQVEQKNLLRETLIDSLHVLGYSVLKASRGKRLIAIESGFTVAKDKGTPVVVTKPESVKASYTNNSDEMLLESKAVKGARSYQHQYTTDAELKEASWISMTPCTSRKCLIEALEPGIVYYFRVGVIGTKTQVVYSDVVSKKTI